MANQLEQLKAMTDVVADTGDIGAIEQFRPLDATTNPSLLLKAAALPRYAPLLDDARQWAAAQGAPGDQLGGLCADRFATLIGGEILKIVPGRVSTEVDARLSFQRDATIERARALIDLYGRDGIGPDRILIKIASTWEGIRAAEVLEREGIRCNLTLLFGFAQAAACAEAGVTLISPFVGRILDWFKRDSGRDSYPAAEDPGVLSVARIYRYYKQHGFETIVMGASFRNADEIRELAGCDRLTIGPQFLEELAGSDAPLPRRLVAEGGDSEDRQAEGEAAFRWSMNDDAMATEKLAEGIRNFAVDQVKLESLLASA